MKLKTKLLASVTIGIVLCGEGPYANALTKITSLAHAYFNPSAGTLTAEQRDEFFNQRMPLPARVCKISIGLLGYVPKNSTPDDRVLVRSRLEYVQGLLSAYYKEVPLQFAPQTSKLDMYSGRDGANRIDIEFIPEFKGAPGCAMFEQPRS